ncbi:MAG TPA: hypothetical protein VLD40_05535 [Dissulfurispiraceae bacterium]|nr:hypothetical protein [Dissulfurispiraceae bacterium]
MKTSVIAALVGVFLAITGVSTAWTQTQVFDGYTVVRGPTGPVVCMGTWIPPTDVALPGTCEGQLVDMAQLSAISSRISADRLEQMLVFLAAIDQKLAVNIDQMKQLTLVTGKVQTSIDQQVKQVSDLLQEAIVRRFEALPEELISNPVIREELGKLREDILKEVERHYAKRPGAPQK